MRQTLWTKNFTIITLGTVISAIGGVAMSFALGFVVFDTTGSTLATALFTAVSALPRVLLPVLLSPYLDNFRRKPVIVGLDYLLGAIYLLVGWYLAGHTFGLGLYTAVSLVANTIGAVYSLAYTSLYPNLIPQGFAQKGYTVSGMLYPTVTVVMTPVASVLYDQVGCGPSVWGRESCSSWPLRWRPGSKWRSGPSRAGASLSETTSGISGRGSPICGRSRDFCGSMATCPSPRGSARPPSP